MKTRDFITGLIIMLFIGLMLTSCQKQEKRIIGEWVGSKVDWIQNEWTTREYMIKIEEDGTTWFIKEGNDFEFVALYTYTYFEDNNACTVLDDGTIYKEPFSVRKGKLYMYSIEWERVKQLN